MIQAKEKLTRSKLNILLQKLAQSDCGDSSCLFAGRGAGGMRTNGGCRCYQRFTWDLFDKYDLGKEKL